MTLFEQLVILALDFVMDLKRLEKKTSLKKVMFGTVSRSNLSRTGKTRW